jgi:hypothetical protein
MGLRQLQLVRGTDYMSDGCEGSVAVVASVAPAGPIRGLMKDLISSQPALDSDDQPGATPATRKEGPGPWPGPSFLASDGASYGHWRF